MKKFFLIGILTTLLIAVPLTVYFLTTQKTNTQSGAAPSTLLAFSIPTDPAVVGTPVAIPVTVDPTGGGSATSPNQISFIKLIINYDGTKLQTTSDYFTVDQKLQTIEGPTQSCPTPTNCTITATVTTGPDPNNTITTSGTTVATLNFNPLAATDAGSPTKLTFATGSQALSIASSDKPAENVLAISRLQPGALTITGESATDTPTPTPGSGGGSGSGGSGSGGSGSGSGGSGGTGGATNTATCSSLTADNTASTSAPFTVLLTGTGGSTAGNVTKVTFNFGDGSVQDITTGGGIGTNNVSVQQSHVYQSNGTYTATAVVTDDQGNASTPSSCSQTITVGSTTTTPTPTVVAANPTAAPTIPSTGPGNVILGVGAVGLVITVVGLLLAVGI